MRRSSMRPWPLSRSAWVLELVGRRVGEGGLDLGAQRRLVGLDREQIVGARRRRSPAAIVGVGGDGVDGDERALQPVLGAEPLQQRRDGGELVRLVGHRLLAEHQAGGGGEGGDEMQRRRAGAAVVAAARGLAVDGHEAGCSGQLSRTQSAKAAAKSAGLIRFIRMVSQRSPGTPC